MQLNYLLVNTAEGCMKAVQDLCVCPVAVWLLGKLISLKIHKSSYSLLINLLMCLRF